MYNFSRSPFSSLFLLFILTTFCSSFLIVQSNPVSDAVEGTQNVIDQTVSAINNTKNTAENVVNGTVNTANNTKNAAESLINGTANAYKDTKNTAENAVNGTKQIYKDVQGAVGNGSHGLLSGQGPLALMSIVFWCFALFVHYF